MGLFLKIVTSDFKNESRDLRELSVVNAFNVKIMVMAKGEYNSIYDSNGYTIHRRTTRPLTNVDLLVRINRVVSVFTWALYARSIRPDYISGHDLVALFIGWLSTWFLSKEDKPLLIYDAHEFEIGRNTKRGKIMKLIIARLEKFLMKKCTFSIMVNDSIADEVQKRYKLRERPIVVRNIPLYWTVDEDICKRRREEICEQLRVSNDTFIAMYHGVIMPGRGIENILASIHRTKGTAMVFLGYGEVSYIEELKRQTKQLKIIDRIVFHDAIPINILWQYVGCVDVGMIVIPPIVKSYYYMLPNKLFENIQSLTPVIGSDFPEIRRIVKGYDIGLLVNPESIDEIVNAIEEMRTNREMYSRFKLNLKKAKEDLYWEKERVILEEAYSKILR